MDELEARLVEAADARHRLIATDGVFSMDGYLAQLDRICDLAERHDALVMVDDSHAVGVVGPGGRGTPEHYGVVERIDILTGHARQGGRRRERRLRLRPARDRRAAAPARTAVPLLEQPRPARRRPRASRALDLIESSHELRDRLRENTAHFRSRMTELGFDVLPGEHPIVPVMVGDEVDGRAALARTLVELGVYAVSFSFPVVPRGTARIRTQMSAAHTTRRPRLRRRPLRRGAGVGAGVTAPLPRRCSWRRRWH